MDHQLFGSDGTSQLLKKLLIEGEMEEWIIAQHWKITLKGYSYMVAQEDMGSHGNASHWNVEKNTNFPSLWIILLFGNILLTSQFWNNDVSGAGTPIIISLT